LAGLYQRHIGDCHSPCIPEPCDTARPGPHLVLRLHKYSNVLFLIPALA
jgi:hypothetical protein